MPDSIRVLTETNRHAGHADILREQLDGAVGTDPAGAAALQRDPAVWERRRATIEAAARAASGLSPADPDTPPSGT